MILVWGSGLSFRTPGSRRYPSWPWGRARAELAAVFLLDGLQAGFADFAVFFGHVGFGDFPTAITNHGLSLSLCRSGCLLLPTRWERGFRVCYPWRTGSAGIRHPR